MPSNANTTVYTNALLKLMNGTLTLGNGTFKLALLSNYTLDSGNHTNFANVSAFEVTGANYSANGYVLGNLTFSIDTSTQVAAWTHDAPHWGNITVYATDAVIYKVGSTGAGSPLLLHLNLYRMNGNSPVNLTVGNLSITPDVSNGSLNLQGITS